MAAESTNAAGHDPASAPVSTVMRSALTSVERSAHIAAASYLMRHAKKGAIIVVDDTLEMHPIAVISERDIVQAVADGADPNDVLVSDLATHEPVTVESTASIREAADLLIEHDISHLPVVDDGRVVGVVDYQDVCRALLAI